MDFLNVGGLELLSLLALAVVLVGPQKAIELTTQIGKFVASMRRTLNSMKDDLQTQLDDETAGLKQIERDVREIVDQETQVFREAKDFLRDIGDGSPDNAAQPDTSGRPSAPTEERDD